MSLVEAIGPCLASAVSGGLLFAGDVFLIFWLVQQGLDGQALSAADAVARRQLSAHDSAASAGEAGERLAPSSPAAASGKRLPLGLAALALVKTFFLLGGVYMALVYFQLEPLSFVLGAVLGLAALGVPFYRSERSIRRAKSSG